MNNEKLDEDILYADYVIKNLKEAEARENDPSVWMDEDTFWKKAETL